MPSLVLRPCWWRSPRARVRPCLSPRRQMPNASHAFLVYACSAESAKPFCILLGYTACSAVLWAPACMQITKHMPRCSVSGVACNAQCGTPRHRMVQRGMEQRCTTLHPCHAHVICQSTAWHGSGHGAPHHGTAWHTIANRGAVPCIHTCALQHLRKRARSSTDVWVVKELAGSLSNTHVSFASINQISPLPSDSFCSRCVLIGR